MFEISNAKQRQERRKLNVRKVYLTILLGILAAAVFPFAWRWWVTTQNSALIYDVNGAPEQRVAIVFGARVYTPTRLSGMLRDRVDTAIDLYNSGQVQKLIMSGDNRVLEYNEPQAMMNYAIANGVPAEDIQPDYGGRRTYDTCYRAREIFQVESVTLVTQEFHLPRALFTCNNLGLDAVGVIADRRPYDPRSVRFSETREVLALSMALYDIIRRQPPPVLGDPLPIE